MASRRSARTSSPEPLIRFVRVRERGSGWPWTIPALAALEELPLAPGVTFLVGENGSGKSTLIEGIAVAAGFAPEGGSLQFGPPFVPDGDGWLATSHTRGPWSPVHQHGGPPAAPPAGEPPSTKRGKWRQFGFTRSRSSSIRRARK